MNENAFFIVKGLNRNHDMKAVKFRLDALYGVNSVSVDTKTNLVAVDYDSSGTSYDEIENSLNKIGYQIAADASAIHTR